MAGVTEGSVALLGTGYIGGSLVLALRAAGLDRCVVGFDVDPTALAAALRLGVIDRAASDAPSAVEDAALVVLAMPVGAIVPAAALIAPRLTPHALLLDVGSVKGPLVSGVEDVLPWPERYVGSHPIAGLEQSGPAAARADLFRGRAVVVTPTERTAPDALEEVTALWSRVGAEVVRMAPEAHDRLLARTSHLPHVVAFALAHAMGEVESLGAIASRIAGTSARDGTRVAASNPAVWRDIFLANRLALLPAIDELAAFVEELRRLVTMGDGEAIGRRLEEARARRARLLGGSAA